MAVLEIVHYGNPILRKKCKSVKDLEDINFGIKNKVDFIVITGPTATGKTKIAVEMADCYNGEIISADSRQIYKGKDIGTGKDLDEYIFNGKKIFYHLITINFIHLTF